MQHQIISTFITTDSKIYFSSMQFNGLFEMNPNTNKISFVDLFNNVKPLSKKLHNGCIQYKNYLVFQTTDQYDCLHVYNLTTCEMGCVALSSGKKQKFLFLSDESVWVLLFDSVTKKIEIKKIDCDNLSATDFMKMDISNYFKDSSRIKRVVADNNGHALFALSHTNKLFEIDLNEREYSIISSEVNDIFSVFYTNGICCLTTYCDKGVFIKNSDNQYDFYKIADSNINTSDILINRITCWNGRTVAFSAYDMHCFEINHNEKCLLEINSLNEDDKKEESKYYFNAGYSSIDTYRDQLIYLSLSLDKCFIIKPEETDYRCVYFDFEMTHKNELCKHQKDELSATIITEEKLFQLDDFLSAIVYG